MATCSPPEAETEITVTPCKPPVLELCWETGTGNSFPDRIEGDVNKTIYLHILNYQEKCFSSYKLVQEAFKYYESLDDTTVTAIGFCSDCDLEKIGENSEKWGAVRQNLLITIHMIPTSKNCPTPKLNRLTYYQEGQSRMIDLNYIASPCE